MSDPVAEKEKMTNYQLQQLFTKAAQLCEKLPYLLNQEFQMTAENGMSNVIGTIKTAMEQVKAFEDVFAKQVDEVSTVVDEHWKRLEEKHRNVKKWVRDLPELTLKNGHLDTRSFKELCDIAERFRHIPEDGWTRVKELAGIIAKSRA